MEIQKTILTEYHQKKNEEIAKQIALRGPDQMSLEEFMEQSDNLKKAAKNYDRPRNQK